MPQYRVTLSDGKQVIKEASSPEEAKALIRRDIEQVNFFNNKNAETAAYLDDYLFDYDEGVPNIKGLRSELAQAETLEERENVATTLLGSRGYTYNSKGEMALTHEGLRRLGLPVKFRTLPNGERIPINTIIDARRFEGLGATLADFSGITGPVIGSLVAMAPPFKLFGATKKLFGFLGGKFGTRAANVTTAAIGGAGGKGVEEAVDYLQGYQKQSLYEVGGELTREAVLGGIGQGIGEGIGIIFANTLGKGAPVASSRLAEQAALGRDLIDIQKLDASLGRPATARELADAVKKYDYSTEITSTGVERLKKGGYQPGAVRLLPGPYVISQAGLERALPGRLQTILENILGNKRTRGNIDNLNAQISKLVGDLNDEAAKSSSYFKEKLQAGISPRAKKSIEQTIKNKKNELDLAVSQSNKTLDDALKTVVDDIVGTTQSAEALGSREFGTQLISALDRARRAIDETYGPIYRGIDEEITAVVNKNGSDTLRIALAELLRPRVRAIKAEIADYKSRIANGLDATGDLPSNALDAFENITSKLDDMVKNPATLKLGGPDGIFELTKNLKQYKYNPLARGQINKIYEKMNKELGFDDVIYKDGELIQIKDDPIFGISRSGGFLDDITDLRKTTAVNNAGRIILKKETNELDYFQPIKKLTVQERDDLTRIVEELKRTNLEYAKKSEAFDRLNIKRIAEGARRGGADADEIYQTAFKDGNYADLRDIFKNLDEYDNYLEKIGKANDETLVSARVKSIMKQKFFQEGLEESIDPVTGNIRFNDFGKYIADFERGRGRAKYDLLFGTQEAAKIRALSGELIKLNPKIKSDEVFDLLKGMNITREGLRSLNSGSKVLENLKTKAEAQAAREAFERQTFITQRLEEATAEEVAGRLFTPKAAPDIARVKSLLREEDFLEIQNAAMDKLIRTAVKPGSKGEITDIFKPGNLTNALDSYGDETLDAMFGAEIRQSLRYLANTLNVLTKGEAGRGAGAGGLIAATLAISFFNIAALPMITATIFMRGLLSSPNFVRGLARTDKTSLRLVLDYFDRTLKQLGVRGVDESLREAQEQITEATADVLDTDEVQDLINTGRASVPNVNMPLPDLSSYTNVSPGVSDTIQRERDLGFGPIVSP